MEWQPIESAPKDGTAFLILLPDKRIGVAFIDPREHAGLHFYSTGAAVIGPDPYCDGRMTIAMSQDYLGDASHWMPLPPPPSDTQPLIGQSPRDTPSDTPDTLRQ